MSVTKTKHPHIDINQDGIIAVLTFHCELDAHIVRHLRHDIQEQTDNNTKHYVVDMTHVPFLDSHGIGLFVSLLKKAHKKQGYLVFTGITGQPSAVLKMVGFNEDLVQYYTDIDDALHNLKNGDG